VGHPGALRLVRGGEARGVVLDVVLREQRMSAGRRLGCTLSFNVPPPAAVFTRCTRAYHRHQFTFLYGGGAGEE
jgi:hypothetical protein